MLTHFLFSFSFVSLTDMDALGLVGGVFFGFGFLETVGGVALPPSCPPLVNPVPSLLNLHEEREDSNTLYVLVHVQSAVLNK